MYRLPNLVFLSLTSTILSPLLNPLPISNSFPLSSHLHCGLPLPSLPSNIARCTLLTNLSFFTLSTYPNHLKKCQKYQKFQECHKCLLILFRTLDSHQHFSLIRVCYSVHFLYATYASQTHTLKYLYFFFLSFSPPPPTPWVYTTEET